MKDANEKGTHKAEPGSFVVRVLAAAKLLRTGEQQVCRNNQERGVSSDSSMTATLL